MIRSTLSALALTAVVAALSGCTGYRAMSDCGGCMTPDCGGCRIPGGWRGQDGCDPCAQAGPCGPWRSGAAYDRTYCVPYGPGDHLCGLFGGCGGGCGEVYWGEWISDPPDACDPCDDCGNWVGERYCPEWMRYTRFVPWGFRDGTCRHRCSGCGGWGDSCGCGVSHGGCSVCGMSGGDCGCTEGHMPVSYGRPSFGRSASPGCTSCGH